MSELRCDLAQGYLLRLSRRSRSHDRVLRAHGLRQDCYDEDPANRIREL
ncbi:MAG: hypothetical protein JO168_13810 [Solirubrobacterales bacterium]|nr:hypothetical protein [Solirubrobacterales bacterium]